MCALSALRPIDGYPGSHLNAGWVDRKEALFTGCCLSQRVSASERLCRRQGAVGRRV